MRRLYPHPYLSALLVVTWLLLVNGIDLGNTALAICFATAIPLMTAAYWPNRAQIRHPFRLVSYVALVLWDVIVANIQVARIILFMPADQIRSAWISIPIELTSPEAIALLAGSITMTPGTMTADISEDGRTLLIHALHAPDPDAVRAEVKSRYEARLKRIFA